MKAHVKELLQALYDGELDESLVPVVEKHLSTCEACQAELQEIGQLSSLMHADDAWLMDTLVVTQREDAFVNEVMHQIHSGGIEQRSFFDSLLWKSIPAGLLGVWLFIQVGWLVLQGLLTMNVIPLTSVKNGWLNSTLDTLRRFSTSADANPVAPQNWGGNLQEMLVDRLHIDFLFDMLVNPALITTLIVAVMFTSWFALWWLHQEKRYKKSQFQKNGG